MSWVDEIVKRVMMEGITDVSDILKADIVREVIYKRVEDMLVGTKVIPERQVKTPDLWLEFPSKIEVQGPLAPEASATADTITWTKIAFTMAEKYEGRFIITDVALARQQGQEQYRAGVRRLAESMARAEDKEILSAIDAAVGATVSCSATWDSADADPVSDIANAVNEVLKAEDLTIDDIKNIALILPVRAYTELMKLTEISGIKTSLLDWLQGTYGLKILPTKQLDKYGYAIVPGEDTGRHYVWKPDGIKLVEEDRIPGVGVQYVVRRFFKTFIIPDDPSKGNTTRRIVKINGIFA